MAAAFERLATESERLICFGITPRETSVFLGGVFSFGTAMHSLRSVGGIILMTSSGLVLTMTNPPSTDADTLS